ncbi:MAG TPA: beta-glucosidase BglX [Novosphingobium sp.]|nr:beta-glucosidase BglX [Novosphingobium sp.]
MTTSAKAARRSRAKVLAAWTALAGCVLPSAGAAIAAPAPVAAPATPAAVRARADALIAQMTPEEKAGQLTQYFDFPGVAAAQAKVSAEVSAGRAGSVLFVTDPVEIDRLQHLAVEKSRLHIPLIFGYDVIHGFRTILPVPIAMAASFDPQVAQTGQTMAASEARSVGLGWAFAPMVDIARDPRWGRMVEGAGEDPYLGAAMAAAQVRGFQGDHIGAAGHIIAGVKHFAGYGAAIGGRDYDEVNLSEEQLRNVYFKPFKAAVDAGAGNLMSAYMALNGVPAAGNHWLLSDVLRKEWGFTGFVVTDAGSAVDLETQGFAASRADGGVRALNAGVDMEMALSVDKAAFPTLPAALAAGQITQARLDEAVRNVLSAKIRMGLFEHPYVDIKASNAVLSDPAHRVIARKAAERTFVLLRNEGGLLPLDTRVVKSIAVIGPLADAARDTVGPWVFQQDDKETVTVLAGLREKAGAGVSVTYEKGVAMPPRLTKSIFEMTSKPVAAAPFDDAAGIRAAVAAAQKADVAVLVLGEGWSMAGEQASSSSLDLPGRQQELLEAVSATGKPVVVLLMSTRPLDLKGAKPQALMDIWYPGTQGGAAVANVLFGNVAPGGRLPFTWPRSVGQIPMTYSQLNTHQPRGRDQRYWNEAGGPLHPFGFGLSYGSFAYSNLRLAKATVAPGETLDVSVEVRNTGSRPGDAVAQMYIHQRSGTSARPVRELKGFERVSLAAGETRTVHFALPASERRYWSAATHGWVEDEAVFDVWAGDDATAPLAGQFTVARP